MAAATVHAKRPFESLEDHEDSEGATLQAKKPHKPCGPGSNSIQQRFVVQAQRTRGLYLK